MWLVCLMVVCSELINKAYIFEKNFLSSSFVFVFKTGMGFLSSYHVFLAHSLQTPTLTSAYADARNTYHFRQVKKCILQHPQTPTSLLYKVMKSVRQVTDSITLFQHFQHLLFLSGSAFMPLAGAFSEVMRTVHSNFSCIISPIQSADRLRINQSFSERLHKTESLYLEKGSCFIHQHT